MNFSEPFKTWQLGVNGIPQLDRVCKGSRVWPSGRKLDVKDRKFECFLLLMAWLSEALSCRELNAKNTPAPGGLCKLENSRGHKMRK